MSEPIRFPEIQLYAGWGEPMRTECTIDALEIIQGEIPKGLNGTLYRNGADRQYPSGRTDDIFIDGVQYSQVCLASPTLTATKTVAVYNPTGATPFSIPGNDVVYSLTVQNSGSGAVDTDTVFIVDTLPAQVTFFNGDMDGPGPATGAVLFTQSGAGLAFSLATDVRFSNSAIRPTTFGACGYAPIAGYDPNVLHVCLNPKGAMAAGPGSSFTAQFRVQIK